MKTLIIILGILALATLIGGLFFETPNGEPATHQLYVSAFCWIMVVLLGKEYRRNRK